MRSSTLCPVSACWPAASVMVISAPLMPLWVVLLPLPLAAMAIGGVALNSPLLASVVPGTLPPVAALPCWSVPTPPLPLE
ncbi:hypothetical protein D9M70_423270 [compost metagenome]